MDNSTSYFYPKVLVIDHSPFNREHNNGIVKSNLFQDWPKDRLAQIIIYSEKQPSSDVCKHYIKIHLNDILKNIFIVASHKQTFVKKKSIDRTDLSKCPIQKMSRLKQVIHTNVRQVVGDLIFDCSLNLSSSLANRVKAYNPCIIFTLGGSYRILKLTTQIAQEHRIPILPLFTDDWISTLYKEYFFERWNRKKLLYWFNRCLKYSPIRLTISKAMSNEYKRRYGGNFQVFMNIVDALPIRKNVNLNDNRINKVSLLYIGSLQLERWRVLREIGLALKKLCSQSIYGELLVYTFPEDMRQFAHKLNISPVMRVAGTASAEQVSQLQIQADVLLHVESFDPKIRKYTKYSISTKIPQYMMSGTCILAIGPDDVASIQYLKATNAAILIDSLNSENIIFGLKSIILNPELRYGLGSRSRNIALNDHESNSQRIRFRQIINESCRSWTLARDHYTESSIVLG